MIRLSAKDMAKMTKKPPTKPRRPRKPSGRSETAIVKELLQWLALHHIFAWRNNTGAVRVDGKRFVRFGKKGAADIIGIGAFPSFSFHYGVFLAIEAKRPGEKQTADQKRFQEDVESRGGIYIVANDSYELEQKLRDEGWRP